MCLNLLVLRWVGLGVVLAAPVNQELLGRFASPNLVGVGEVPHIRGLSGNCQCKIIIKDYFSWLWPNYIKQHTLNICQRQRSKQILIPYLH